ncbi:Uncharacterised protein [Comamonas terrigena]|nr:Uncharacterised protein [Comamonas terrigena]
MLRRKSLLSHNSFNCINRRIFKFFSKPVLKFVGFLFGRRVCVEVFAKSNF